MPDIVERTQTGIIVPDDELFGIFTELYEASLGHEGKWTKLPSQGVTAVESPVFRFPQPGSMRRGKAKLHVYSDSPVYPRTMDIYAGGVANPRPIRIMDSDERRRRRVPLTSPTYSATLPLTPSDGEFNLQSGHGSNLPYLGENKEGIAVIDEHNPERLVIQRIIGAALDQFTTE